MLKKLHFAWIWFWYNDITRISCVLLPLHFIFFIPFYLWIGVPDKSMPDALGVTYIIILMVAMFDNDYSNLRKIGLDEYRCKLPSKP